MPEAKTLKTRFLFIGISIAMLLSFNGWFLNANFQSVSKQEWWVNHTNDVINNLDLGLLAVKTIESSARGYMLTGKDEYLAPVSTGTIEAFERLQHVKELTEDNPVQQATADLTRAALEKRIKALEQLVALYRKKPLRQDREAAPLFDEGRDTMTLIKTYMDAMKKTESALLQARSEGANKSRMIFFWSLLLATISSGLLITYFVWLIYKKQMQTLEETKVMEKLKDDADAANFAKSQFLANMSHEIRTPLAAVMGFADLIAKGNLAEDEKGNCSEAVNRNGQLLMQLIDDVLDLSKIEAGRLELEHSTFSFTDLLVDTKSTMAFRAEENGTTLTFNIPKMAPGYMGDPTRIKQTLLNIIGNAIKFSKGGQVLVDVQVDDPREIDGVPHHRVKIFVIDNGIGLSKAQQTTLFRPFSQGDSTTRRKFGGSGLGLVISRRLARAMDGDVKLISSEINRGSTFLAEFSLPLASSVVSLFPGAAKSPADRSLDNRRILAVDDVPDNLQLISLFLKKSGAEVVFADSGPKALEAIGKSKFDLVLMDLQMPGMDGHEATRELRKRGFKKPIIAVTAHALKEEHEQSRKAGCNSVLTKPIDRTVLVKTLQHFLIENEKKQV